MLLAAQNNTAPANPICLLTAIVAMALAARVHGTDKGVVATAFRVLPRVDPKYQGVVLQIMNSPAPLAHINAYVANLPDRILKMKVGTALPPYVAGAKAESAA